MGRPKICVAGIGALGGTLAAMLGTLDVDLSVVARGATLEAIHKDGIVLREGAVTRRVRPAAAIQALHEAQNLVILNGEVLPVTCSGANSVARCGAGDTGSAGGQWGAVVDGRSTREFLFLRPPAAGPRWSFGTRFFCFRSGRDIVAQAQSGRIRASWSHLYGPRRYSLCDPTHINAVCAVAMKREGFSHDNLYGAQLFEWVGYHDFEGITPYDEERPRLLDSLGDKHVLVLRNHGIAVGEADVSRTFFLLWIVQRAAETQCQAGMIPGADVLISDDIKRGCARDAAALIAGSSAAEKMFDAAVRKMRKERGPLWPGDEA